MTGGRAVILGPTGRNLAAGMSGGVAYVLDLDPTRVNRDMVDLDPLDDPDRELLHDVVRQHEEETGSVVAGALLADWRSAVARFSKVMPKDYKRVLVAQRRAEAEGRDVMATIMEAAHG
jgi:glutamate synthase (NADPH/NADH) large chain